MTRAQRVEVAWSVPGSRRDARRRPEIASQQRVPTGAGLLANVTDDAVCRAFTVLRAVVRQEPGTAP